MRRPAIALVVSTVVAWAAWVVIGLYEYQVPFLQLWSVTAGAMLLWWIQGTLGAPAPGPAPPEPAAEAPPGRPFGQAERWQRRLWTTEGDPDWFAGVVRDRIAGLVDERLRQRHGARLVTGPAREILGGQLHDFLIAPLARPPTPAELERYLTRIEEI